MKFFKKVFGEIKTETGLFVKHMLFFNNFFVADSFELYFKFK